MCADGDCDLRVTRVRVGDMVNRCLCAKGEVLLSGEYFCGCGCFDGGG